MKSKKYAIYAKKSFDVIKKNSEIIVVTPGNLEELLMVNAI